CYTAILLVVDILMNEMRESFVFVILRNIMSGENHIVVRRKILLIKPERAQAHIFEGKIEVFANILRVRSLQRRAATHRVVINKRSGGRFDVIVSDVFYPLDNKRLICG